MSSSAPLAAAPRRDERQRASSFAVLVCFGLGIMAALFGLARASPNAARPRAAGAWTFETFDADPERGLAKAGEPRLRIASFGATGNDGIFDLESDQDLPASPTATSTPEPDPPAPPLPPAVVVAAPAPGLAATGGREGQTFWTNGDSTSYFMSVWLTRLLRQSGVVPTQAAPEYKISSGLLSPGFFDWPAYIEAEMARTQPSIVVFMVGANDANGLGSGEEYRRRVGGLMDQMCALGRLVVWVGQPNMGPNRPDLQARVPALNAIVQEEASGRSGVVYVDTWALTSDANGAYSQFLPNEDGVVVQVRADDGVHFTSEGGRRLAIAVMNAIVAGR